MKNLLPFAKLMVLSFTLILTVGCSHNIQMTPDLTEIRQAETNYISDKSVAYYISTENRVKQVTTPGGGGDKVTYKPYVDSESALNTVLSKFFKRVYSLKTEQTYSQDFIKERNISLIFIPGIKTSSSSSSIVTWPPTRFSVNLSCKAVDTDGETVWQKNIYAEGNAEFSEFKSDFSLAARRATAKAFEQLMNELNQAQETLK